MKKKIVLIGGGGHCKSIIDSIQNTDEYSIEGIVDVEKNIGKVIYGIKVIGKDEDLKQIYDSGVRYAFISVGSIGDIKIREILYKKAKEIGYEFPVIKDKYSIIANNVIIDEGVFIGKGAIINSDCIIKANAIINSGAIIEHDCNINEFVHIAPGATVCGGVFIGYGTHIGCNASILQGVNIGEFVIVGAGSVVIKNINKNSKVVGNPSREV